MSRRQIAETSLDVLEERASERLALAREALARIEAQLACGESFSLEAQKRRAESTLATVERELERLADARRRREELDERRARRARRRSRAR